MHPILPSLRKGWSQAGDGHVGIIAAGVAYYGFLALIPLLAAAILTYGLVVDPATIAAHGETLARNLPGSASGLVAEQMRDVADSRGGAQGLGLVLALALSLISARAAARALITALNIAFEVEEERGFIAANLLALAITLGAVLALGLAIGAAALLSTVFAGVAGALAGYVLVGLAGSAARCWPTGWFRITLRSGVTRPCAAARCSRSAGSRRVRVSAFIQAISVITVRPTDRSARWWCS